MKIVFDTPTEFIEAVKNGQKAVESKVSVPVDTALVLDGLDLDFYNKNSQFEISFDAISLLAQLLLDLGIELIEGKEGRDAATGM